jgi:hypothetical protein
LILLVNKNGEKSSIFFLGLAALCLALYYLAWIFYHQGVVAPWLLVGGLAAMPPVYFIFLGLWLKNYPLLISSVIFGITHIAITYANSSNIGAA